jgi:hypothetical protein
MGAVAIGSFWLSARLLLTLIPSGKSRFMASLRWGIRVIYTGLLAVAFVHFIPSIATSRLGYFLPIVIALGIFSTA